MQAHETIKKLSDEQVEDFDMEYVTGELWDTLVMELDKADLVKADFSFLDIGGGNGVFTDRILEQYPNSQGFLLDNSRFLLDKNKDHPRKTLVEASAESLTEIYADQKFDIIFMNWFLHHTVKSTFSGTLATQREMLATAHSLLKSDGKLVIFENLPEGLLGERFCSFVINRITSSKILAPFVKKMGGNTAGVGICFLGEKQWSEQFSKSGFSIASLKKFRPWDLNPIKKALLTIKDVGEGLYILNKQ
ncbi:MAG: class I SAM-dependent methyltransferase [Thiotrichaceae bacterium]